MLERDLELPPGYFDAIDAPKPVVKVTSSKMNFGAVPLVEIGDVLSENKKIEDNRIVFPFSAKSARNPRLGEAGRNGGKDGEMRGIR